MGFELPLLHCTWIDYTAQRTTQFAECGLKDLIALLETGMVPCQAKSYSKLNEWRLSIFDSLCFLSKFATLISHLWMGRKPLIPSLFQANFSIIIYQREMLEVGLERRHRSTIITNNLLWVSLYCLAKLRTRSSVVIHLATETLSLGPCQA